MTESLKKYLTQICQFFGFGFTIPMGKFLTNTFINHQFSATELVFSLLSLFIGVLAILIGATIAMYEKELSDNE